ncbi:Hexokinase [Schistosoma japonicum]|nr:Hexokinase [Schistosoma japonicum]
MVYSDEQLFEKVVEVLRPFDLSVVDYEEFCDKMDEAMRLGLQKSTNGKSSIKMFPSYVTKVPNGTETGNFLALDLGGTNYRVLSVTLEGKGKSPRIQERTYSIPAEKMSGTGTEFATNLILKNPLNFNLYSDYPSALHYAMITWNKLTVVTDKEYV